MNCEVVLEKLSCYVDGVIDEATMEMIEDHLEGCAECSAELAALEALTSTMSAAYEVEPPVGLKLSIYEAIGKEEAHSAECEQVVAMLSEFVDGELEQSDRVMVAKHVAECHSCADELMMTQQMLVTVGSLCEVEPPMNLKARIAAATVEATPSPFRRIADRVAQALTPVAARWTVGSVAAAALVLVAIASPIHETSIVTISDKPQAKVDEQPVEQVAPIVAEEKTNATVTPVRIVVAPTTRRTHHTARPVDTVRHIVAAEPVHEPTVVAAKPVVNKVAHESANRDTEVNQETATTVVAEIEKQGETTVDVAAKPDGSKKETSTTETKEVKLAGQFEMTPEDDKAMVRRLKQQMRRQETGGGLTVNLFDTKF